MPKYFPYDEVRPEQDKLISAVVATIKTKQSLVANAPTGLGKTVAALVPALEYALENNKVVLFLTGRHTQHQLALETARAMKERHKLDFGVVDLIGKQWLCLQPGVEGLRSRAFSEYCKAMKADKQCEFYENLKKGEELSSATNELVASLRTVTTITTHEVKEAGSKARLCPYEITLLLAAKALLIITDYQYVFNADIRDILLNRIGRELGECILIVDEAHNLPDRVKDLGSDQLSTLIIGRAISEAEKHKDDELASKLKLLGEALQRMAYFTDANGVPVDREGEKYVSKEEFLLQVERIQADVEALQAWMAKVGDSIREEQRSSFIGAVADFLRSWLDGEDVGYARILTKERGRESFVTTLHYRCLDPSIITHEVFEDCHSAILMSGTLTPPQMYGQLLGLTEPNLLSLESPFPAENRLNLVIPKTSTRYTQRSEQMWKEIAEIVRKVVLAVPGNVAVFFPSYAIMEQVQRFLDQGLPKTVLAEVRGMTKEEKHVFLNRFRSYQATGAVLLAVISGNYGEGIDLPGDELKGVVVVGLPLSRPDLEAEALISYYDTKFRRGREYGYIIPAFNKTLQSAGRCIRSGTDRGVIVFIDERYEDPQFLKLFPKEWRMKSTLLYEKMIREFFERNRVGSAPAVRSFDE
jgi:DNA excision repair protein ERCC-2